MPRAGEELVSGHDGVSAQERASRMEIVGRIAAGLAHDLNGPIGVVLGFTGLARERIEAGDGEDAGSITEYLKMIEQAGNNARDLARDMWDFARAAPGEISEFDLAETLSTAGRLVGPSLRVSNIEPPESPGGDARIMRGDRALWTEAAVGLLLEAPTALPRGGSVQWNVDDSPEDGSYRVDITAIPGDVITSVNGGPSASSPAEGWMCGKNTIAIVEAQGGRLTARPGPGDGQTGIELLVPRACGER